MSEVEPAAEKSSPGQTLAAARAERKLSIADVSQQIKYGVKQIAAIEADDYASLPGTACVRGMIRSYAKLVQIDAQPLLAELGRRNIPAPVTVDLRTDKQVPFLENGKKSNRIYALLSVAALAAVVAVGLEWYASPPATREVVTVAAKVGKGAPVQTPPPSPAYAPQQPAASDAQADEPQSEATPAPASAVLGKSSGSKRIELDFDQQSWVEIKQANGKILMSQLNPAGSRKSIDGVPPFEVVIGNAGSVKLTYDDAPVDLRPHFRVDVARLTLE